MALAETAELAVRMSLDNSQFNRAIGQMNTRLSGLGDRARAIGGKVARVGAVAAGAVAGLGVLAI